MARLQRAYRQEQRSGIYCWTPEVAVDSETELRSPHCFLLTPT